ncbi:MAG TPA: hypothetical protein VGV14_11435 [Rhodanobacter sp.]|nr:hypothetical protein [Rhodanobacter sp.]
MAKSLGALIAALAFTLAMPDARADQTIVFLRHGEKPALGLGQINCQGLNRALALPQVLQAKFGTPTAIYAPDPGSTAKDKGVDYDYVRPLATIEPTAIRLGLPVNTSFGLRQIQQLEQDLLKPTYSSATIYVAWEHNLAQQAAQHLVAAAGGKAQQVPAWATDDFDSLYVLHVKWQNEKPVSVRFERQAEGLNHQSVECPGTRS